ncbi:MAG: Mur ligase domain-containing protein [Candidatus Portnoybacteria bacterium]
MKIHFIGIGGIGVSALAQYYLSKGHKVTGSDLVSSEITEFLEKKRVNVQIGPSFETKPRTVDLVIYSPAIQETNLELKSAKEARMRCLSYPQAVGEMTKQYYTIAVSGTHGKSTTTSMVSLMMQKAGLDPTVIIGTKLKEFGDTNFRAGKSNYLVLEADEHFASFLNYWPKIIILTSLEADHLDFYHDFKTIFVTFKEYLSHLPKEGILIANQDDKNIEKIIKNVPNQTELYSLLQKEAKKVRKLMKVPGEHNVSNALSVLALGRLLKVPQKTVLESLSQYKGSWRRFETSKVSWKRKKIVLISDYGHHPTEVKVTMTAARSKYPKAKIWCVFQPHQYQRTFYLFKDFVKVFKNHSLDKVIITDIYDVAGREEEGIKEKVSSEKLVEAVKKENVLFLKKEEVLDYLKDNFPQKGVLMIMGAGNIYKLVDSFNLTQKTNKKKIE